MTGPSTISHMQFSELFTALLEYHNNTVVIRYGATLRNTDICCSPAFRQYSGVTITVHNALPILTRFSSRGTDLNKPTIGLRLGLLFSHS